MFMKGSDAQSLEKTFVRKFAQIDHLFEAKEDHEKAIRTLAKHFKLLYSKYGVEKYGPNRYHIVTAKDGFHGRTFGAMSATGQPGNACQVGFGPMTYGFSYAPYNDLKAFEDACTENTIAIMIEPVQGEGGVHPATKEFMTGLRKFCDEHDMLLLIDEVQTGWCRTGAVMSYLSLIHI